VTKNVLEIRRPERRRLLAMARKAKEPIFQERCFIILALARRIDGREVARTFGVAPAHVSRTRATYRLEGVEGLMDKRCNNGHRKVTKAFRSAVAALLLKVPPDFQWMRPPRTRELLCLQMERLGFEKIADCTMSRVLNDLGARLGRPKPVVLCPWPRRKKQRVLREIRRLEARASALEPVLYVDEVDIHLNPKIGRDWVMPGHASIAGSNTVSTCTSNTCGLACSPSSYSKCGSDCFDLTSNAAHCGTCTTNCASTPSTPKCSSGSCAQCLTSTDCPTGKSCNPSTHRCEWPLGAAQASCGTCLGWDFESGTNGWVRDSNGWPSSMFDISRVASPTYNNSGGSLAITVNKSGGFAITVPVCSATDLSSLTFSAQFRIHDLGGASTVNVMNLMFSAPENQFTPAGWITTRAVGVDSWIAITGGNVAERHYECRAHSRGGQPLRQFLVWHGVPRQHHVPVVLLVR
jgi:hypothetical protein